MEELRLNVGTFLGMLASGSFMAFIVVLGLTMGAHAVFTVIFAIIMIAWIAILIVTVLLVGGATGTFLGELFKVWTRS